MARLETYLATGALFPSFIDIVAGRSKSADIEKILFYGMHEPEELVIVLLDNGRKKFWKRRRISLIYSIVSDAAIVFSTARLIIPSVPPLERMECWAEEGWPSPASKQGLREGIENGLFLCTTCGLCGEVCPVGIDAGKRLKDLRRLSLEGS